MLKPLTKSAPSRLDVQFHELKMVDEQQGIFEGYLAVFGNLDSYNDVIERGAFTKTIAEHIASGQAMPICWQHNPGEPIGKFLELREDQKGLFVRGQLDLDVERGRHAYSGMKKGYLNGLSIGYDSVKEDWDRQTSVRHLREIRLWEGSVVTWPANGQARVDSVKAGDDQANAAPAVPVQAKQVDSLEDIIGKVRQAVRALASVTEVDGYTHPKFWLVETFPDAALIMDSTTETYFKVSWSMAEDGNVTLGDLQEVEQVYVPVAKAAQALEELKAGRRHSGSDIDMIKAAIGSLFGLLDSNDQADVLKALQPEDEEPAGDEPGKAHSEPTGDPAAGEASDGAGLDVHSEEIKGIRDELRTQLAASELRKALAALRGETSGTS